MLPEVPNWVSSGHPSTGERDEHAREARKIIEEAFQIVSPDHSEDMIYLGTKRDEAMALEILGALRNSEGGTYADRVRFLAQILARHRKPRPIH